MSRVKDVKKIAKKFVMANERLIRGFRGAHLNGAIASMSDEDEFPVYSDIDIKIVVEDKSIFQRTSDKVVYKGHLVDWSLQELSQYESAEVVLRDPITSSLLAYPTVLADTNRHLESIQQQVEKNFANQKYVDIRCNKVAQTILQRLNKGRPVTLQLAKQLADLVLSANLDSYTIRRLLVKTKAIFEAQESSELQELLLQLVGSHDVTIREAEHFSLQFIAAYDIAVASYKTPLHFPAAEANMHPYVRPYLVEGHKELLKHGHHRELIWWNLAVFKQIMRVIRNDVDEEVCKKISHDFARLKNRVGWLTNDQIRDKDAYVREILPEFFQYVREDRHVNLNVSLV